MQRLYAAFGRGDIDGVLAELAEDVDWAAEAAGSGAPWYGTFRGREAVPGFFAAIAAAIDIHRFEVIGCTAGGSDVIATVRWAYTVKATGRSAETYMQHWWRFVDGRIVWFRGSEDSAQTVAAFASSSVDLVRAGYAAFARGDIPAVLTIFAEDAQWYAPDELPTGGTFHGPRRDRRVLLRASRLLRRAARPAHPFPRCGRTDRRRGTSYGPPRGHRVRAAGAAGLRCGGGDASTVRSLTHPVALRPIRRHVYTICGRETAWTAVPINAPHRPPATTSVGQ